MCQHVGFLNHLGSFLNLSLLPVVAPNIPNDAGYVQRPYIQESVHGDSNKRASCRLQSKHTDLVHETSVWNNL